MVMTVGWKAKGSQFFHFSHTPFLDPQNYELAGCLQTRGAPHPSTTGTFHHHVFPSSTGIHTISQ